MVFVIRHVASALELGAKAFLTFDRNQKMLTKSEGLVDTFVTSFRVLDGILSCRLVPAQSIGS
jgi:hypothetical protein